MTLWPWESYQLQSNLPPGEVLRLLKLSIPGCKRWPDLIGGAPYFCGCVDDSTGWFHFSLIVSSLIMVLFSLVLDELLRLVSRDTERVVGLVVWLVQSRRIKVTGPSRPESL